MADKIYYFEIDNIKHYIKSIYDGDGNEITQVYSTKNELNTEKNRAVGVENEIKKVTSDYTANGYSSVKVTKNSTSLNTMAQLRTFINSKNSEGKHFLFDFSDFAANAYVCGCKLWTSGTTNYCQVYDLLNQKLYIAYEGYIDSTTISDYLANNGNDIPNIIPLTDPNVTLSEIKTMLDEINSLGHHVFFNTYALGSQDFYLTTISISNDKVKVFDLVGAKMNAVAYKADMTLVEVMNGAEEVITEANARVLTDLIAKVSHRVSVLEGTSENADWDTIQARVVQGLGAANYPTYNHETRVAGTQIVADWARKDSESGSETTYSMPFNVVLHTEKASVSPIAILDDEWSIDSSIFTTTITDEAKFNSQVGNEKVHANHMMYLESEYTLPMTMQFDAPEALLTVASGKTLPAGTYYVKWVCNDGTNNNTYLSFTLSSAVSGGHQLRLAKTGWQAAMVGNTVSEYADGNSTTVIQTSSAIVAEQSGTFLGTLWGTDGDSSIIALLEKDRGHHLNHGDRIKCGYNRWSQSGLRQWLNATGYNWWKSMNVFDVAPSYKAYRGYMGGLSENLINVIKPVRRYQRLNTVTDGGYYEYTYDKVFLHAPYERYCQTENNGSKEGSCQRFPYYQSKLDTYNEDNGTSLTQFGLWQTYAILKRYNIANQSSAQHYWSQSARRSLGSNVWFVYSSGTVTNSSAHSGAIASLPAFVITQ